MRNYKFADTFSVCWDKTGAFQRCCDIGLVSACAIPSETMAKVTGGSWLPMAEGNTLPCSLQSQARYGGSYCRAALTLAPFGGLLVEVLHGKIT